MSNHSVQCVNTTSSGDNLMQVRGKVAQPTQICRIFAALIQLRHLLSPMAVIREDKGPDS